MKKTLTIFLILISVFTAFSQIEVKKSKDIVLVLGRKYYIHTVKAGETLFGISRVYEVPQEQIILINKEKVVRLETNSALRIPIIDDDYEQLTTEKISFIQHTVGKRQSLYSISKQYGITEQDIIKYNPEAKNGIKKKQILKIPVFHREEIIAQDEYFIYHKILEDETLYSITKKYNVTEKQILQVNPGIDNEFKVGRILSIPKKELTEKELLILKGEIPELINVDPLYFTDPSCLPCKDFVYDENYSYKIALLMPFFLNTNYSRSFGLVNDPDKGSFYGNTEIFFEYYEGMLLAINDLRELGMSIDLFVYDTEKDSAKVSAIFNKFEMQSMDLIIGPVYSDNYDIASNFAAQHKINIISPFSKKNKNLRKNPFFFQVNPSEEILLANSAKSMTNYADSNIVIIHNNSEVEQNLIEIFKKNLVQTLYDENDTINIKEVIYKAQGKSGVKNNLIKGESNIVIIPSSSEVFVSNILNYLNTLASISKYRIVVYGMPSWEMFQDLELIFYKNLNVHFPTPNYTVQDDWQVESFKKNYLELFNTTPSVYSYQGYDIAYYFLSALKRYGKYFQFCISNRDVEPNPVGLSLYFNFLRIDKYSGFENNGVHIIRYDENLDLKKVHK